jgi:cytochrome P450
VDQALGGRAPTLEDLPQLKYTRRVIDESLRLYPPAWIVERSAIAEDRLGGYQVPRRSVVLVSPFLTHRHPEIWPNPERFDPDRFTDEASAARPPFAYFPFGGGPRQCIGNNFALMEAQLILATVAQQLRLTGVPGFSVALNPLVTLRPRDGLKMVATRRR